jgi:hypothetical protein
VDDARMKRLFDRGGPGVFRPLPLVPPGAAPARAPAAELTRERQRVEGGAGPRRIVAEPGLAAGA